MFICGPKRLQVVLETVKCIKCSEEIPSMTRCYYNKDQIPTEYFCISCYEELLNQ